MTSRTPQVLLLLALTAVLPPAWAHGDDARQCRARNDSIPTSLGADGWAAVDGPVTGGCSACFWKIVRRMNAV